MQCGDMLKWKYYAYSDASDHSQDGGTDDSTVLGWSGMCVNQTTYFPLRRNYEVKDNIKYYIRPLECKLADDYDNNFA